MTDFEKIEKEAVERGEQEVNEKLGIQDAQGSSEQGNAPDPNQEDQQDPAQNQGS